MFFGIKLILILAIVGGIIAYIGDKLGSKIGKKRLRLFGMRPHDTSVVLTILSGVLIAAVSITILAASSKSTRVALFGMEQLQRDLAEMNRKVTVVQGEYKKAMDAVKEKNEAIAKLDKETKEAVSARDDAERQLSSVRQRYSKLQGDLVATRGEVSSLTEARDKLNAEIKDLQLKTDVLQKGLYTMKEGQVLYQSGEVVFAGVVKAGLSMDESRKQVNWLLESANKATLSRLGFTDTTKTPDTDIIWTPKEEYLNALNYLMKNKGSILIRVRAMGNTVVGEPVICKLDITPNTVIYKNRQLILSKDIDLTAGPAADEAFMTFLKEVNARTVEDGVLPDPVTGKVGNMNALDMVAVVKRMQKLGGMVRLSAYADGEITTGGPVLMKMDVVRIGTAQ